MAHQLSLSEQGAQIATLNVQIISLPIPVLGNGIYHCEPEMENMQMIIWLQECSNTHLPYKSGSSFHDE